MNDTLSKLSKPKKLADKIYFEDDKIEGTLPVDDVVINFKDKTQMSVRELLTEKQNDKKEYYCIVKNSAELAIIKDTDVMSDSLIFIDLYMYSWSNIQFMRVIPSIKRQEELIELFQHIETKEDEKA